MNRYLVTAPIDVLDHAPGTEFDHEFAADAEGDYISSGRLEIVARRYRVIGTSRVSGTEPGGSFLGRYTIAQEAALLGGGHMERSDPPAVRTPTAKPDAVKASKSESKGVNDG